MNTVHSLIIIIDKVHVYIKYVGIKCVGTRPFAVYILPNITFMHDPTGYIFIANIDIATSAVYWYIYHILSIWNLLAVQNGNYRLILSPKSVIIYQ